MPPKKYYNYTKEDLKNALEAIKGGVSCASAAKQYKVPRSTLIGKIKGKYPEECRSGVAPILNLEEEDLLEKWIINLGKMGFPVTKDQLIDSVALLVKNLKRPNPFADGRPGRHWFEGFLRRHPNITRRITQNITASRAAVTRTKIELWFKEIQEYFNTSNTNINDPERIFNTDETAMFLSPKGNKVLAKKGIKSVYDRSGDEKECLTVLVTGNAAGQLAPPMIMYPYERIPKHIVLKVPSGWGIGKSESGWMTSETFFEYITNIFYPWLVAKSIKFPVLLYLDGHKSHVTMPLTEFCRDKEIILISLPPNSTHVMQPLDVGFFKPLKCSWKKAINNFKIENNNKILNRENFAPVIKQSLETIPDLQKIFKNSFKSCGLFPFDSSKVNYNKLILTNDNHSKEKTRTENPDIINHLNFFETYIDPLLLTEFYNRQGAAWKQNDENKKLYETWLKIFMDSGKSFDKILENHDIIIEIEDGLILEEGWENLITLDEDNVIVEVANNGTENSFPNISENDTTELPLEEKPNEIESELQPENPVTADVENIDIIRNQQCTTENLEIWSDDTECKAEVVHAIKISNSVKASGIENIKEPINYITCSINGTEEIIEIISDEGKNKDKSSTMYSRDIGKDYKEINEENVMTNNDIEEIPSKQPVDLEKDKQQLDKTKEYKEPSVQLGPTLENSLKILRNDNDGFSEKKNTDEKKNDNSGIGTDDCEIEVPGSKLVNDTNENKENEPDNGNASNQNCPNLKEITDSSELPKENDEHTTKPTSTANMTFDKAHGTPEKNNFVIKNDTSTILPGVNVPSPFKTALFWPGPTPSKKSKRPSAVKIPSVGTSDDWRNYFLNRETEKQQLEDEKKERKRKREEKSSEKSKTIKNTRNKKAKKNLSKQMTVIKQNSPKKNEISGTDINVGDFFIVAYLDNHYPGKVMEIKKDKYLISTMARSGLNKWKWPIEKDEILYELKEIVEKIDAPVEINKRGFFEIKELEKYQNFLLD